MIPAQDDASRWREQLLRVIASERLHVFDRVEVVRETGSTQDEAHRMAAGRPGLVLLAERQTSGRGRLGRVWEQRDDLGLALTVVLDARAYASARLSLAVGLAAAKALDGLATGFSSFGVRWPNDVVEPTQGGGRKVAGALIEVRGDLALVGVGVNVYQRPEDFPGYLRHAAVSVRQLGSLAMRVDVAASLLRALTATLAMDPAVLAREWIQRDVLTGTRRVFIHDRRRIEGLVESIDPTHEIVVRTAVDSVVRLPAMTTSLVHE